MAKVPNAVEILPKISTAWVGRTSLIYRQTDRQTDNIQTTDGRATTNIITFYRIPSACVVRSQTNLPWWLLGPSGMSDRLRASKQPQHFTSLLGQLSLLTLAGREMSTGKNAVTLCGCW